MKKHILSLIAAILLACCIISCEQFFNPIDPDESLYRTDPQGPAGLRGEAVYYTSFESAEDVNGWEGIIPEMLYNDPSPGGGNKSLHIGGGCLQPEAHIDLPDISSEGNYTISCWGKPDVGQGWIVLTLAGEKHSERPEAIISIRESGWTNYNSSETIYCPKGKSLRIEIYCGGAVYEAIYIDQLTVHMVK